MDAYNQGGLARDMKILMRDKIERIFSFIVLLVIISKISKIAGAE